MNKIKPTRHNIIRKHLVRPLTLLLCAASVAVCIPASSITTSAATLTDSKVQSYEDRLAQIEKDIKSLKSQYATSQKNLESARQDKQNLDEQIKLLMDQIEVTNSLIAELDAQISDTTAQIDSKQSSYEEKYELFKERMRVTYEDGQISYLQMLFEADSLSEFLLRADRIGAMLEYDNKIMNDLKDEKSSLEDTRTKLSETKQVQEAYIATLKQNEQELEAKSAEADALIKKLQSSAATYQALTAQNEEQREKLEEELEAYLKELEARSTAKYVGGTFMWPVPLDYTYVSSEYCYRNSPITGRRELHNGMDIPAPLGTNVYASNSGTVITATYHWSYGYYIMIDHGGGYITLYAHNSKLCVSVGDKVTKGQVIAKVGSTGDSTGNHCHFSIRENGVFIDPRKYFPA